MVTSIDVDPAEYPEFSARDPIETLEDGPDFDSSNVHSLLYDFGDVELFARFYRDGADAIYRYPDFPAHEWASLADAPSKGRYINLNIREQYGFERLRIAQFPDQGRGVDHPVARRFLTAPISTQ